MRGLVVHVYGEAGSGKTTLALRIASSLSGRGFQTIYVSRSIPRGFLKFEGDRVVFLRVSSDECLVSLPETVESLLSPRVKLIVVDSVAGLFRNLRETGRLRLLPFVALRLRRTALKKGLCVLLLNEVTSMNGEVKAWEGEEVDKYSDESIRLEKWMAARVALEPLEHLTPTFKGLHSWLRRLK